MKLTIVFKDEYEGCMKKKFGSFPNPLVYNVRSVRIEGVYLYATSTACWRMDDISRVYCEEG